MLEGVEQTATRQIELINDIKELMDSTKVKLKNEIPKIYSKDLLEVLFIHPYTKIDMLVYNLGITRQTASKHLKELELIGLLEEKKIKNSKFYINKELFAMLQKGI